MIIKLSSLICSHNENFEAKATKFWFSGQSSQNDDMKFSAKCVKYRLGLMKLYDLLKGIA